MNLQLNKRTLETCVSKMLETENVHIKSWTTETVQAKTVNFTTAGVYKIHGQAVAEGEEVSWSLVLKIIKPENEEKNDPQHHNYWKREALVYQSTLLENIPPVIHAPACYLVEEKGDRTIWLWMAEVQGDNNRIFSKKEFAFIARQLGLFHGSYVTGQPIPDEPWICRNWLESWIDGCKKYARDPNEVYPLLRGVEEMDRIWEVFSCLERDRLFHLENLQRLPRVLAHQDLSQQNLYVDDELTRLTLIDWQYLSISGLGEDLGKMFGVAMSQRDIPSECGEYYQELLFDNYLEGLRAAGWNGDCRLPKYGFYISLAYRSAWEVPKLFRLLGEGHREKQPEVVEDLVRIVTIQLKLAAEADGLAKELWGR